MMQIKFAMNCVNAMRTLLANSYMLKRPNAISKIGYVLFHLIYHQITMVYILVVALEFLLATIGVACLIRHYNHKV